ncbi:MAG: arylesterase [Bacteriovoracaceae bacterium]
MKKCLLLLALILNAFSAEPVSESVQVICLGDSLTEGYGIKKKDAYPALLESMLKEKGFKAKVVNGGVSGSTTASGKSRLEWLLKKSNPDVLILALGANDGLRGLKLAQSQKNLEKIIELAQNKKIKILLAGMKLPPNYGKKRSREFHDMYDNLQKRYKLKKIPFMLENVGGKKELNLKDGIHPNEQGHKVIAETIMKHLEPLL